MAARRVKPEPKKAAEPKVPPQPRTLSYHYEKNNAGVTLREKRMLAGSLAGGGFMALWLTAWTAGCVKLAMKVMAEPTFFMFCFAIPFWAAWVAVFCALMAVVFGRQTVRLDDDGLASEYRVLLRISSRRVPLKEIRYVHVTEKAGEDKNSVSHGVEAVTDGKPIELSAKDLAEAQWLAYDLNQTLAALAGKSAETLARLVEEEEDEEEEDDEDTQDAVTIAWNARPQRVEPPSDCRWRMKSDYDATAFQYRGVLSLLGLGFTTFITLFWNGIVSVFVLTLWGFTSVENAPKFFSGEWWFLFVFLIPFEVIGLGFFLTWFCTLFAPFFCIHWLFGRHEAVCRATMFGIGRTWRYSLENCREMVIAPHEARAAWRPSVGQTTSGWKITFVDFQDRELFTVPDLTHGEARWMADQILGYR